MKRVLAAILVIMLAFTLGCSKNDKDKRQENIPEKARSGMKASLIDQVSKEPVDIAKTPYVYVYGDVEYYFKTKENMEAFKKDPEKYLNKK